MKRKPKVIPRILWHYTKGIHLPKILDTGLIAPATAFVPEDERPVVWFSTNQWWEPSMAPGHPDQFVNGKFVKPHSMSMAETAESYGLARIGVAPETAPHDWQALKKLSGMTSRMAQGVYRASIKCGARPGEWRGTFNVVPKDKWRAVEVFQDGRWQPLDDSHSALLAKWNAMRAHLQPIFLMGHDSTGTDLHLGCGTAFIGPDALN